MPLRRLRINPAVLVLIAAGVLAGLLVGAAPASAASSCPTQTFLQFDHLAYASVAVPSTVQIPAGVSLGGGTIDEPTSSNGCHRKDVSVTVLTASSLAPPVAVLVAGRAHTIFVVGERCAGFAGSAYWDCLLSPLAFGGQQFTATSYPSAPAPQKPVALGAAIGTARYHGHRVTVRRIQGVAPSLAIGISGQPSTAFLSPSTCPYSGFSNTPEYDNLLRCLHGPVWFTFDPLGGGTGETVVARADRPLSAAVVGASLSFVQLPVVADVVPADHGPLIPIGRVAEQVSIQVPKVSTGVYEAVVSCPSCASRANGEQTLFPAGSILLTAKTSTSLGIRIVSYALLLAFLFAAFLAFRTWRRRRGLRPAPRPGARRPGGGRSSRR